MTATVFVMYACLSVVGKLYDTDTYMNFLSDLFTLSNHLFSLYYAYSFLAFQQSFLNTAFSFSTASF